MATPFGLLMFAQDRQEGYDPEATPPYVQAALLDADTLTWRSLPRNDRVLGIGWTWTGSRAISANLSGWSASDATSPPMPYDGALELPEGRWTTIPDPPEANPRPWPWALFAAAGPRSVIAGHLYDDTERVWSRIEAPEAALTDHEPGPAVWTDQGLVVLGSRLLPGEGGLPSAPLRRAWLYRPPPG